MFTLIHRPEDAEPIIVEMFKLFAKNLNKLSVQINGVEFLSGLKLLEDCSIVLKKVEQILKDHPQIVSTPKSLEYYNRVMDFKRNADLFSTELADNFAEEVKMLVRRRFSDFKSSYASQDPSVSALNLVELKKHLDKIGYAEVLALNTNSSRNFLRSVGESLVSLFHEQLEKLSYSFAGLDLALSHFGDLCSVLGLHDVDRL